MNIREDGLESYWSRRARTYGKRYGLDTPVTRAKIERKVQMMAEYAGGLGNKDVLEIGCGTGLFTDVLVNYATRLIATDISGDMLGVAKASPWRPYEVFDEDAFLGKRPISTLAFRQMDARNLSFKDESQDVVVAANLFQHTDTPDCIEEVYRVLRPGGALVAVVPNILNPLHYCRARVKWARWLLHEDSESVDLDRWHWHGILEGPGAFKDVVVTPIEFTSPYTPKWAFPILDKCGRMLERLPGVREFAGSLFIGARKC